MRTSTMIRNIQKQEWSLIAVHWKDKEKAPVFVKVRELSDLQIQAIGNFSLLGKTSDVPMTDFRDIANMADLHSRIIQAALVSPSYDALCSLAGLNGFSKIVEKRCLEIEHDIAELPRGPVRSGYEQQLAASRLLYANVLPNVFMSEVVEWVLGVNRTNIKMVTDEIILNAAFLRASAGSGRVSDYIDDKTLSPFNKRDIDTRGAILYADWKKGHK